MNQNLDRADASSEADELSSSDARLKEYEIVTEQFRNLTEVRFKLLTLLPVGTIGTLGILESQPALSKVEGPIGIFGLVITLALATYNLRNDQHYDELVARAAQLEREVGLFQGSFAQRPDRWHRVLFGIHVEHRWPVLVVYAASAALWLWIALAAGSEPVVSNEVAALIAVSFAGLLMWLIPASRKRSSDRYQRAVREAIRAIEGVAFGSHEGAAEAAQALALHLGGGAEGARRYERRILFYLEHKNFLIYLSRQRPEKLDLLSASLVLGQAIDMPARWIFDICSGRRG